MTMETIILSAKPLKKHAGLDSLLEKAGFDEVLVTKDSLTAQKRMPKELKSAHQVQYEVVFGPSTVELHFTVLPTEAKHKRMLEVLPLFYQCIALSQGYYSFSLKELVEQFTELLGRFESVVDKDSLDLSTELNALKVRSEDQSKKYQELMRSSESNARILLEYEQRQEELSKRVKDLESLSNEVLKEELFKWIKAHNGSLDLEQFCKAYHLPFTRAEEGIRMLMQEGYLKRV